MVRALARRGQLSRGGFGCRADLFQCITRAFRALVVLQRLDQRRNALVLECHHDIDCQGRDAFSFCQKWRDGLGATFIRTDFDQHHQRARRHPGRLVVQHFQNVGNCRFCFLPHFAQRGQALLANFRIGVLEFCNLRRDIGRKFRCKYGAARNTHSRTNPHASKHKRSL